MSSNEPPDKGRGSGGLTSPHQPQIAKPNLSFADVAQAASVVKGGRAWHEIFADAKQKRNILEIHLTKVVTSDISNSDNRPKHLSYDELSIFLFDILKIN